MGCAAFHQVVNKLKRKKALGALNAPGSEPNPVDAVVGGDGE